MGPQLDASVQLFYIAVCWHSSSQHLFHARGGGFVANAVAWQGDHVPVVSSSQLLTYAMQFLCVAGEGGRKSPGRAFITRWSSYYDYVVIHPIY